MAFNSKKIKDYQKRMAFKSSEVLTNGYNAFINNDSHSLKFKQKLKDLFTFKFKRKSSVCRVKNRCLITNRSKSVIKFFRISRITFRELARNGDLLGVTRSSW